MKIRHLLVLSAGLFISANAMADGAALAKQSGCMTCHAVDKKMVGPSFKAVAEKYKGDSEAAAKLAVKVRKGGKGSFGATEMLATPAKVSDDDIKNIVAWILTLS
ncbi:MAG TPA: c-type cytochrome [Gallionellaceae bacterium]